MLFFDGAVTPAASPRAIVSDAGLVAFQVQSIEPSIEAAAGYVGDDWTSGARRALVRAGSVAESQLRRDTQAHEVATGLEDVIRARLVASNT